MGKDKVYVRHDSHINWAKGFTSNYYWIEINDVNNG